MEEDFGDTTLFEFLSANRAGSSISPTVVEAYRKVVALLPRFQIEAGRDINYKACYPRAEFDEQSIAWDLNYFKYYFLKLAGVPFNEQLLEDDFKRLTAFLLSARSDFFLYRDFQSRNIMLRDGQPFFLDYQGGRKGRFNTISPLSCSTPRPICRRHCARNYSIFTSSAPAISSRSSAPRSCTTTTPMCISV